MKQRITTFIDMDIYKQLNQMASADGIGYQTLLNDVLRNALLLRADEKKYLAEIEKDLISKVITGLRTNTITANFVGEVRDKHVTVYRTKPK